MSVEFASIMSKLGASEIRELLKLTARKEVISFAGGLPAPELFPVKEFMAASAAVMTEAGEDALCQVVAADGPGQGGVQAGEQVVEGDHPLLVLAPVEFGLDIGLTESHSGRATIHHATDSRAMGFAKVGNSK